MSFFENISKKVGNAAQAAVKKSGEIVEVQKINMNIKTEDDKIEKFYLKIGKMIYTKYCSGTVFDESVKDICEQVKDSEKKIQGFRDKVAEVKRTRICVICGKEIEKSSTICSVCGSKQDITLLPNYNNKGIDKDKIQCKNCMQINNLNVKICTKCGEEIKKL